jgi:hypothetical protein
MISNALGSSDKAVAEAPNFCRRFPKKRSSSAAYQPSIVDVRESRNSLAMTQ